MGSFSFFHKKKKFLDDFSLIGTDIHSHILPGIDDGAKTIEDSISLTTKLRELGFSNLVFTPHVQSEFYRNDAISIEKSFLQIEAPLKSLFPEMQFFHAAEYLLDDGFALKLENKLETFAQQFLLVEFSYFAPIPNFLDLLTALTKRGYRVVLAHPERYSYWYNNGNIMRLIKDLGVYFQVNLISLGGHFGDIVQKQAERMLSEGLIDFAASDLHHERHFTSLEKALSSEPLYIAIQEGQIKNSLIFQ